MSKKSKWDSSSGSDNDDNNIVNEKKIRNGANKKTKTSINSVDDNNNIDRSVIKIDGIDIMNTSHVNNNHDNNDLNDMNVISSESIIVVNDAIDQQLKCDSDEVKLQYDLTAYKDVIDPVSNNSDENMNAVTTNITTTDASHQSAITINPTSSSSLSSSSSSSSYVASTKRMMITTTSNTTSTTKHTYNPLFDGCRSVDCYQRLNFIDQGTYGMVFKAKCRDSHEIYALKQIKFGNEISKIGFPITALREINILLSLNHPNIVKVKEMVIGSSIDKIYMVMEYCENDLKTCMKLAKQSFSTAEIKQLMIQLLSAISYIHERWYIHRDLKTSNLLYSNKGYLAVCDFGLARKYGSPLKPYTFEVVTLWYRAPELLLGSRIYNTSIDIWSIGCIFAEMLTGEPLFPGDGEIDQINKIFKVLGVPNEEKWPNYSKLPYSNKINWRLPIKSKLRDLFPIGVSFSGGICLSELGLDLLNKLLCMDPKQRITAADALQHPWLKNELPKPTDSDKMPTFKSRTDDE